MADLDGICLVKSRGRLVPADMHADDMISNIGEGKEVMVTLRRPRNPKHHRLLWALLRIVISNDPRDRWTDEESLLCDLKRRTGLVEPIIDGFTGRIEYRMKSISFAAMSQDQFSPWFDRAVHVLATEILNVAPQTLVDQVLEMADGQRKAAA
jgi:hypothetical protein